MTYVVYILECSDGTLYTGITNDIAKRVAAHNEGKTGAKYTRARRPVKMVYCENKKTRSSALKREAAIKKMTREEKWRLVKDVIPTEPRGEWRGPLNSFKVQRG